MTWWAYVEPVIASWPSDWELAEYAMTFDSFEDPRWF